MSKHTAAHRERKRMLTHMVHVVMACNCEWPLMKYRNGDGHHPECPVHVPFQVHTERRQAEPPQGSLFEEAS